MSVEELKATANIVDVIEQYTQLSGRGNKRRSKCPFCDSSSQTLGVIEDKQYFNCFKCGTAGDVITFVRLYEQISFIDSYKKLCRQYGIKEKVKRQPITRAMREQLLEDKFFLAVYNDSISRGEKASYADKQRYKLSMQRKENIENMRTNV